jgi:hypothetical protein
MGGRTYPDDLPARCEHRVLLRPIQGVVGDFLPALLFDGEVGPARELLAVGDRR